MARPSDSSTNKRQHVAIFQALGLQGLQGEIDGAGEGSAAAGGHLLEAPLGHFDAPGGREQDLGPGSPESDEAHPVATLVGIEEQRHHRPLDGDHPALRSHGTAGVDDEQDQGTGVGLADLLAHVPRLDEKGSDAPPSATWRRDCWWGAAARRVASRARSDAEPSGTRAPT